eukprot:scaffold36082_cov51-Phaeocystis_antarctica.AAC.4
MGTLPMHRHRRPQSTTASRLRRLLAVSRRALSASMAAGWPSALAACSSPKSCRKVSADGEPSSSVAITSRTWKPSYDMPSARMFHDMTRTPPTTGGSRAHSGSAAITSGAMLSSARRAAWLAIPERASVSPKELQRRVSAARG